MTQFFYEALNFTGLSSRSRTHDLSLTLVQLVARNPVDLTHFKHNVCDLNLKLKLSFLDSGDST